MPATETAAPSAVYSPTAPSPATGRLLSIDVYRGLTVAGMILVTDPGTYSYVYPQFSHAVWNGVTLTDMIAPSFLFLVGMAMSFSFASRARRGATRAALMRHVLFRVAALIVLGLLLNGFPDYSLHYLRIPGILQHIAVCLLFGGLLHCVTGHLLRDGQGAPTGFSANWKALAAVMVLFVVADWVLMRWVPVPGYGAGHLDPFGNMGGYIDRSLFGTNHLWQWGNFWWDPDGMLTTLPASANLMLGLLAGELLRSSLQRNKAERTRAVWILLGSGILLLAAGVLLDPVYPINKKIWTPSYTLFSGGFCLVILALSHGFIDRDFAPQRAAWLRRITAPVRIFGANSILAFIFSTIITTMAARIRVTGLDGHLDNIPAVAYEAFAHVLAPRNASLLYAVLIVLLNLLLLIPFHRRRIFLKL